MLFLDLAKAFDTVDYSVLYNKLRHLGFKHSSIKWFESYLRNRKQATKIGNALSDWKHIGCGVPQGSILGPLLFICYMNDLPLHVQIGRPFMYADDTAILYRNKTVAQINADMTNDIEKLHDWFSVNKLSVNVDKTQVMLFSHPRSNHRNELLKVNLNNRELENVTRFKYLGVLLDNHLNFQDHIKAVKGKVDMKTGLLWRIRTFISQDLALQLYKSLIAPHFAYCCHIYDGCSITSQRQLQVSQNNALRAVLRADNRSPTERLHESLNIEWLDVARQKTTCLEAFKIVHGLGPSNLNSIVKQVNPVRSTRSGDTLMLECPRTHTKLGDMNFKIRAYHYWKGLPPELRRIEQLDTFKCDIKKYEGITHIR